MAYRCKYSGAECDGCMACAPKPVHHCTNCEEGIYEGDHYYVIGKRLLCEECMVIVCRHTAGEES